VIACRVAACLEPGDDRKQWSIYVLNDGTAALGEVVLRKFGHEWGDLGGAVEPGAKVRDVAPGSSARIWRDNDEEMRMWGELVVRCGDERQAFLFEFPLLYRHTDELQAVPGIGLRGWVSGCTPMRS
jgi:hypothetical protein